MGLLDIVVAGTGLALFAALWAVAVGAAGRFRGGIFAGVAVLALVLGVTFLGLTDDAGDALGVSELAILAVGVSACLAIAGFAVRRQKRTANRPIAECHHAEEARARDPDIGARLRKLETLRKDGLISEIEYQTKRSEMMREKW